MSTLTFGTQGISFAPVLSLALAFGLGSVPCAADEQIDAAAAELGMSSAELEYSILREVAKDGSPAIQLDAFLHVNDNLPELRSHFEEALGFLRASAESGYTEAQYVLGFTLVRGKIVDRQIDSGLGWLEKAAESGHERAVFWIGNTHTNLFFEASRAKDKASHFRLAELWLDKAIAGPDVPTEISTTAMSTLGRLYAAKDIHDPRGLELLFKATDLGSPQALRTLERLRHVLIGHADKGSRSARRILDNIESYFEHSQTNSP